MASLWITVFETATATALGPVLQSMTAVAVGAGSLQSAAVAGSGRRRTLRLFSDTDCHVAWGDNPTADTTNFPMGAENPEYISIDAGQLVAVIQRV